MIEFIRLLFMNWMAIMADKLPQLFALLDRWLLHPHVRVTDPEKVQRSRLLSIILLVLAVLIAAILFIVIRSDPSDISEPTVQGAFVLLGIFVVMYILNRLGATSVAALGFLLPFAAIFIYIPIYSGESPIFLAFLLIPILLTAIFFSVRQTSIFSVAILVLVGVLLSYVNGTNPDSAFWNLRNMWFFLLLGTGLILTFMWHLAALEDIRQKELKRINQELEQKVAELERFTYTVSHELKSPIVTMKGFLGSVERDLANGRFDQARTDLLRISHAADKMHATMSDLLALSRVGRIVNPFSRFPLSDVVREAIESTYGSIEMHNIQLRTESAMPFIYGDRQRLREVFENLIDNAAKYMGDQPHPRIEIGVRNGPNPVFYVKDNGIGIEPQYFNKVFGLFDKLDPKSEGTGIGLALVKRIVEVHGGKIWVESEGPGEGSTFCFTIPNSMKEF